jgi:hypothetical protein
MSLFSRVGLLLRRELSTRLGGQRRRTDQGRTGRPACSDADRGPGTQTEAGPEDAASDVAPEVQDPTLASFYANLELPYGADVEAVREARRRLLRRYHPDLHSSDPEKKRTATRVAQGLNRAHDELVGRLARKQQ